MRQLVLDWSRKGTRTQPSVQRIIVHGRLKNNVFRIMYPFVLLKSERSKYCK